MSNAEKSRVKLFASQKAAHSAANKRVRSSIFSLIEESWSIFSLPLRNSIRVRFNLALVTALFGITLLGAIATISSRILLTTFERNVAEATKEVLPSHELAISLLKAERLIANHKMHGDPSALLEFRHLTIDVDRQFDIISDYLNEHVADRHEHDIANVRRARAIWNEVRKTMTAPSQAQDAKPEPAGSFEDLSVAINSAYQLISEFHHHAMEEMHEHLIFGRKLARATHYVTYISIFIGFVLLTALVVLIGRSLLEPIEKLQEAAERFGKKDLSHRVRLRNSHDELGQLAKAFNSTAVSLQYLYDELERRSNHDGLTGVLNRAAFDDRLSSECKSADRHDRQLSLLMVDIDFFKRVNDDHGHQTGDKVLQHVARIIRDNTRPGDVVARYGGEEFGVILPETDESDAMAMAERLRKAVEAAIIECGTTSGLRITLSLGCATRYPNSMTVSELVKIADEALYRAKTNGRNRVCASPPTEQTERGRLSAG